MLLERALNAVSHFLDSNALPFLAAVGAFGRATVLFDLGGQELFANAGGAQILCF